ncbi:hypothetical protein FRC03_011961 [Tulasnella sp. 419]|nr:hypothetical protein FRC03_011961 [Tulasnella sp. 419]
MNGSLVSARDLRQMAEKVDRFINTVGQGDSKNQSGLGCTSSESINWESCSSLTSIYSGTATSIGSQSSTPMVKPIALPDTLAGSRENIDLAALNGNTPPHDNFSSLYAIPAEWRKPTCLKTRNELIVIAQDAISFIENYGESIMVQKCQRRSFKSAIAIRERMIRSRRYLDSWPFEEYGYDGVYDDLMLTMARVYSYYAFQTAHYRMQPVYDWSGYVDSNDPTRNIVRHDRVMIHVSGCDHYLHLSSSGVPSLLGGLFAPNLERDNITISSAKTVMFMTISSYIAEFTGDKKHTDIAILAANCIKSWMLDSATSLIKDSLVDALTAQERSGSELSCHLTGMTIEGFTVLASVTGDDGWRTLAIEIAIAAMRYSGWHSPNGILTVCTDRAASENTNVKAFKGLLNRGLMVAYERNRLNEPFCNMVRSYINVQFNALYELSRVQDAYGVDWRGPYAGPYGHALVAAFDTIIAALGVNNV